MTVIVAALMGAGVVLPTAALVTDVGSIYVEREQLQSGADSAAVSVATACAAGRCASATDVTTQVTSAKSAANANAADGVTDVTQVCGNWGALPACPTAPTNLAACVGTVPAGTNYVEVRVRTKNKDGSTVLPPVLARTFAGNSGYSGTAVAGCARATASDVCVTAAKATYTHTFDGPGGKATITAKTPLCKGQTQAFSLVSYTAPDDQFAVPQFMYDSETKSIDSSTRSLSFQVDVPACYTQVDFVFGSKVYNPLNAASYGSTKVGEAGAPGNTSTGPDAWYNGGSRACNPQPTVSFSSQCDGTMNVVLGNGSTANIDAAFTVAAGNDNQFLRVAKGGSRTVTIAASAAANVTVQDNTFDTSTGRWAKPRRC